MTATLETNDDVLDVYLMGSLAREDGHIDKWSDVCLTVFVAEPVQFPLREWLSSVCPLAFMQQYTPRHYRILFQDGVMLELGLFSMEDIEKRHPLLGINGGRLLLDRDQWRDQLTPIEAEHAPYAWTAEDNQRNVSFLLAFYMLVVRRLKRGEVYSAYTLYQRFTPHLWQLAVTGEANQTLPFPLTWFRSGRKRGRIWIAFC